MYKNLRKYISVLEENGELLRVAVQADPVYEITEITDRESKKPDGGKALLFENTGAGFPVLTNMFGSDRRMALALGVGKLDEITERIESLFSELMSPKEHFSDKLRMLPLLNEMSKWMPKKVKGRGECQQVVAFGDDVRLSLLPILKCWPYDGGRFVTFPLVNTVDPDTGGRNVGMYRMQVTGENTTGMHWHMHKTGERHYRAYKAKGQKMPVSVCIGGDPAYTYAATAPMPDNMDEYLLAGFLRRKNVKLVKCLTNEIYVPSDCDFVIEGYVDPSEDKFVEGPFGDHTGFYSLEDHYPVFHVTAITHRKNAVYPATIVGIPPQEDAYIAKATEKIFLAPIRLALQPEVKDLYMPPAGVAHNLALMSIEKSYPGQAFKTAASMWGAGQMMFNKAILITSAQTDVRNADAVARLVRNADINKDVLLSKGVLDVLDHSTSVTGTGGKIALDLTEDRRYKEQVLPGRFELPDWAEGVDTSFADKWGVLLVGCHPEVTADGCEFLDRNPMKGINYIVFVDLTTISLDPEELLWFCAGNTDPERDIKLVDGVLIADCRTKSPYREGYPKRVPNVVASSKDTIEFVDKRWTEYGLGEFVESPSIKFSALVISAKAEV